MHDAPSEASILRTMYEKEMKDHKATKQELSKLQELISVFLEEEDLKQILHPDKRSPHYVARARAAIRDALLPRGVGGL